MHRLAEIGNLVLYSDLEGLSRVPGGEVYAWLVQEMERLRAHGADPDKVLWTGIKLAASGHARADRAAVAWAAEQGTADALAVACMVLRGIWTRALAHASPDAIHGLLDLLEPRPGGAAPDCLEALDAARAHPDPGVAARVGDFLARATGR